MPVNPDKMAARKQLCFGDEAAAIAGNVWDAVPADVSVVHAANAHSKQWFKNVNGGTT